MSDRPLSSGAGAYLSVLFRLTRLLAGTGWARLLTGQHLMVNRIMQTELREAVFSRAKMVRL